MCRGDKPGRDTGETSTRIARRRAAMQSNVIAYMTSASYLVFLAELLAAEVDDRTPPRTAYQRGEIPSDETPFGIQC